MIKKLTLSLLFLFFVCSAGFSQNIRNGITGGLTAAQIDGDNKGGFDKPGLMVGGSSAFLFNKRVSLQPEILFIQKGSRSKDKDPDYLNYRLNYISLPLQAGYRITPRFNLQGGLTGDFLLKAKVIDQGGSAFVEVTEHFKRFDINVAGGVEYQLSNYFGFNVRYMYSVLPASATNFRNNFYNNAVGVSLRYYFTEAPEY